jgi:hypothetical protein
LVGVWQRNSIRWPDGREDTTTRVWWLQANPHFADLRIPADRPNFSGINSWQDCDPQRQAWLRRQQGFAGILMQQNDAWLWRRDMDIQPPTGKRDIGRLRHRDESKNLMIEEGVDEPYVEIWQRIDNGAAFVLSDSDRALLVVVVGNHFLLCHQSNPLLELSHGIRNGPMSKWTITDSTLPWREGQNLFMQSADLKNWKIHGEETPDWVD